MPFYVGDRFNEEFTGNNLKTVERSVEEDYISNLRNNCWKEKQQSKSQGSFIIDYFYISQVSLLTKSGSVRMDCDDFETILDFDMGQRP